MDQFRSVEFAEIKFLRSAGSEAWDLQIHMAYPMSCIPVPIGLFFSPAAVCRPPKAVHPSVCQYTGVLHFPASFHAGSDTVLFDSLSNSTYNPFHPFCFCCNFTEQPSQPLTIFPLKRIKRHNSIAYFIADNYCIRMFSR